MRGDAGVIHLGHGRHFAGLEDAAHVRQVGLDDGRRLLFEHLAVNAVQAGDLLVFEHEHPVLPGSPLLLLVDKGQKYTEGPEGAYHDHERVIGLPVRRIELVVHDGDALLDGRFGGDRCGRRPGHEPRGELVEGFHSFVSPR